MLTSSLLVFVVLFLTAGVIVTGIAAWRRVPFAPEIAIAWSMLSLLLWILLGFNLPASLILTRWTIGELDISWLLIVDPLVWRSSLYLLLISVAVIIFARPDLKPGSGDQETSPIRWFVLPVILFLVLSSLLAIWADSLATLASSWTLLGVSWLAFVWIAGYPIPMARRNLTYGGMLVIGVGFLWLAEAASSGSALSISNIENWSEPALILASLAALVFLGAIPFHLWRSITDWTRHSIPATVIVHLVPAIVGGSLLARIASYGLANTGYLLFVTGFGLIGYLVGISIAWIHLGVPMKSLSGIVLAEAAMVMLVGTWATPSAVIAQVGVFALSIATFYLISEKPKRRFNWPIIVPVGALAGMPVTIGFLGLAGLYESWFDQDLLTLMLVMVFLNIPLISVAILAWRSRQEPTRKEPLDRFQPALELGGLALLTLGLLLLPDFSNLVNKPLVWLPLLFGMIGGLALARVAGRSSLAQIDLKDTFRINIPKDQAQRLLEKLWYGIKLVIRESISILEGEGGMLWVVVLIIVMWLARRG